MTDTIHRHDENGPEATIDCADDGTEATATWVIPAGQLADDHPELNAGGYIYFTDNVETTAPLPGADLLDFSGIHYPEPQTQVATAGGLTPGTEYRAHLLVAYEDGPAWHNDTVFVCEGAAVETTAAIETSSVTVAAPTETLPVTGPAADVGGGFLLAVAMLAAGIAAVLSGRRGAE